MFTKLWTCNHRYPIETGRLNNIDKNFRKCTICDINSIGNKFHYVLECTYFANNRQMFLSKRYHKNPNKIKLNDLINTYDKKNICQNWLRKFPVCSS